MTEDHFNPSFPGEGEVAVSRESTRKPARPSAERPSWLPRRHRHAEGTRRVALALGKALHKDVLFSSLRLVRKYLKNSYTDQAMAVEGIW